MVKGIGNSLKAAILTYLKIEQRYGIHYPSSAFILIFHMSAFGVNLMTKSSILQVDLKDKWRNMTKP